jgi:hypothetical protein
MLAQKKTAEPSVVNGINLDDLFALMEGVKRDAAKGKTNWRVTTTWQSQTRSRATIESFGIGGEQVPRRFSIDIDEPCELGGSNRFSAARSAGSARARNGRSRRILVNTGSFRRCRQRSDRKGADGD